MVRHALVQERGNGRLEDEERGLLVGLRNRGIVAELFTRKRLERGQLTLDPGTLVAGEVTVVEGAVRRLGVTLPPRDDYPEALRSLRHRRIWRSTVGRLIEDLFEGRCEPIFAKPLGRKKRFTGHVFRTRDDLFFLEGASRSTAILCSEVVEWLSEARVFVANGRIVGIRNYAGDPSIAPDGAIMAEAVSCLEDSGEATAGYGLDLGVLTDGRTALVEWNDGYALGAYGLEPDLYTELILARWTEIMRLPG